MRAVAVLSVLIYHFFPKMLHGGFTGVDIFFVISGFLITRIILTGLSKNTFCLKEFYRHRIRRIFPALILVITFVLVAGWLLWFSDEYLQVGRHVIASSLFLQNFMLLSESGSFDPAAELKPLLHLWSLSVEERFYLFWPLLLILGIRRGLKPLSLITPLFLFSFSFAFNLWMRHADPASNFFGPLSRFWELLLGALLVFLPDPSRDSPKQWTRGIVRGVGLSLIVIGLFVINPKMSFPGFWALLPTVGAGLLIAVGSPLANPLQGRILQRVAYIGRISYPLYLWHWPLFSLGDILHHGAPPLAMKFSLIATSFGLAALTYHGLEKPVRKAKTWLLPGIFSLAMGGLIACGAAIIHFGGFPERAIELQNPHRTERSIPGYASLASSCPAFGASERLSPHCKVFSPESYSKTMVLWGDSSAIAWTPVFLDLAKSRGARLIVVGHTSCPPLLSARKTHFDLPESAHYCQDGLIQEEVLRLIERVRPDLIIYMGALGGYRTDAEVAREDTEFMTDQAGEEANRESNRRTLVKRLPETLKQLTAVAPVLAFRTWPLLPKELPPPTQATLQGLLSRGFEARQYPRAYFDAQRQFVDALLEDDPSDRLDLFSPATTLCDDQLCSNAIDGILAYSDRYHITPLAALRFRKPLNDLIDRRLGP